MGTPRTTQAASAPHTTQQLRKHGIFIKRWIVTFVNDAGVRIAFYGKSGRWTFATEEECLVHIRGLLRGTNMLKLICGFGFEAVESIRARQVECWRVINVPVSEVIE